MNSDLIWGINGEGQVSPKVAGELREEEDIGEFCETARHQSKLSHLLAQC